MGIAVPGENPPEPPAEGPLAPATVTSMISFLEGPELIIVLVVVLVLFGGSQLPKFARNLGSAQKEFKKAMDEGRGEDTPAEKK